jgi:signal transduction histidine kinase
MLKHIVMNLVSNAIKFSPEEALIEVETRGDETGHTLSVWDRGIGISAEDQKHLFERFFRAGNATNIQGTGLGLHIVAKYAELMGGTIRCESELDKGTTFIVTFPRGKS